MHQAQLIELAAAIADGTPIDWEHVDVAGPWISPTIADRVRLVERVARLHATLPPVASFSESLHQSLLHPGTFEPGASETPVTWGPLTIDEKIGRGTFGDVYRARDPRLDRPVALKLLRRKDRRESAVIHEGRLLARVRHPNVVTVYGAERIEGRVGLWMEFIEGRTLEEELKARGPFAADEIRSIGIDLARALGAVHQAGLLHRDLKAQNVMRDADGRVLLTDFGAGREVSESALQSAHELAGTPLYMAPEVLEGHPASVKSDIYSLGVLLYHLATGSFPLTARSLRDLRDGHARGTRLPLRSTGTKLPRSVAATIDRAIDPDPAIRFASAAELERALTAGAQRPLARVAGIAMMLVAITVTVAVWRRPWADVQIEAQRSGAPVLLPAPPASVPLNAGDWVIVAAVNNQTGETTLDDAIEAAITRELEYSDYVRVVQPDRIEDALQSLDRPYGTRLDISLAREVAIRDGQIRAVISGSVSKAGDQYTIRFDIVNPNDGGRIATVVDTASNQSAVLPAIRRQTLRIRQTLGEPSASLERSRQALVHASLPSLKALHLHAKAQALGNPRNPPLPERLQELWAEREKLIRQALQEDPTFARGLIALAGTISNQGRSRDEFLPYAERAFKLADQSTPQERYNIAGSFHYLKGGMPRPPQDNDQRREVELAVSAYEALFALQPDSPGLATSLRFLYRALGRDRDSDWMYLRLADVRPTSLSLNFLVASQLLRQGNFDAARRYGARAESALSATSAAADPDNAACVRLFGAYIAWLQDDPRETLRIADQVRQAVDGVSEVERRRLYLRLWDLYSALGRLLEAERMADALRRSATGGSYDDDALQADVVKAMHLKGTGMMARFREFVRAHWRDPVPENAVPWPVSGAIAHLIEAGLLDEAERNLEWFKRRTGLTRPFQAIALYEPIYMNLSASLELARGRPDAAIALLQQSVSTILRLDQIEGTGGMSSEIGQFSAGKLAEAFEMQGNLPKAIEILKMAGDARVGMTVGLLVDRWVRGRAELARLHRKAGHPTEARAIEAHLTTLFAVADPDYPLLRELRSRSH